MKRIVKKLLINNERLCEKLNRSQKFYYLGIVLLMLAGFWWLTPFNSIFITALLGAGILLTCGAVSDILVVYKKIWNTNIGKGLVLVLYAAATNLAYALSAQFVNEIIKFESAKLVYATNFVAVMLIPLFVVISTFVVFFIVFMFGQFYIMIAAHAEQIKASRCLKGIVSNNIENYPMSSFLVRMFVFPAILGLYWGLAGHGNPPHF